MNDFNQFFHYSDFLKAGAALLSGLILGYERELKDKSAGLKTISIISLGSALYAILSQNLRGEGDNYAIAAGIISGIGFLGAGVIFKEGFSIYGLTTAGVIWVSAAIGMSIGFGEFYIAGVFLLSTMVVIYATQWFGKHVVPNNLTKNIIVVVDKDYAESRHDIIDEIEKLTRFQTVTKIERIEDENLRINLDIYLNEKGIKPLEDYLIKNKKIILFSV